MTGNEYQELAMRTNDGCGTDRLAGMVVNAKKGTCDAGGLINGCLGLAGESGRGVGHGKEMDFP